MAKRFTDTEKFSDIWYRKLSLLHKVIWEYLLAECNHAGIFKNFDLEMMSFKIGAKVTEEDLKSFKNKIIFIADDILFIPNFIQFQYGELNPQSKVHASVLKELEKYNIDTLSIEYLKSSETLKNKDKDIYKDKEKNIDNIIQKNKKFVPPSLEEVKNYCFERNNDIDAERFINFYESKGWFVGKNKMKDWKAAVRTWENKNKTNKPQQQNSEEAKGEDFFMQICSNHSDFGY